MRKKVIHIFIICLAAYLFLLGYLYLNQRAMMYFPDKTPVGAPVSGEIAAVQTSDGLQLQGWFFPAQDAAKPIIIFFHGNAGNITHRLVKIAPLRENGYSVLLAGYRGYGGNAGSPSENGFYEDARAYIGWLEKRGIAPTQMIFYGESIGSGVAVQMGTEFKPAAVILEAAYSSTADIAAQIYPFIPVRLLLKDQYRSVDKIGRVPAPILLLHGEVDTIIPADSGRTLFEAAQEPKTFVSIPNAGHNDVYDHGAALHVLQFLASIAPR